MKHILRFAVSVYGVLLRLYPRGFRRDFADEMRAVLAASVADAAARGGLALAAVCLREVRDWPAAVVLAYWRERRDMGIIIGALRWIARALSLVSIGILSLFFVGEGFNSADIALQGWIGLAFFPVAVVAGLIVAWWKEGLGGGIAILGLLGFYGVYGLMLTGGLPRGWFFVVFASPGFLFLAYAFLARLAPRTA